MRPSSAHRPTLHVLIDEHWPANAEADWVLTETDGTLRAHGCSTPDRWPGDATLVVVLGASQSSWHRVTLPKGKAATDTRLIAYALEDVLLDAPQAQHITLIQRHDAETGSQADLIVTARDRLRTVLTALRTAGHEPRHLYTELQSDVTTADGRQELQLCLRPGLAVLHPIEAGPVALPDDIDQLMPFVDDALRTRRRDEMDLPRLRLHADPGCEAEVTRIEAVLGSATLQACERYAWWRTDAAADLLHGEFSVGAAGASLARRLRLPLALAASALLALAGIMFADILRMRSAIDALDADIASRFAAALPGTPRVMPEAQLHRRLEDLRRRAGAAGDADLLPLLGRLAEARDDLAPTASVTALDFGAGRLSVAFAGATAEELDRLRTTLAPAIELTQAQGDDR